MRLFSGPGDISHPVPSSFPPLLTIRFFQLPSLPPLSSMEGVIVDNGIAHDQSSPIDIIFVNPLDPSLLCPVCHQALRSPLKLTCSHKFCLQCISVDGSTATCLVCQQQGQAVPDKATQKIVQSLQVFCSFQHNECKWAGELKDLPGHVAVCQHKDIVCSNGCGEVYQKMNEAHHLANDCGKRSDVCPHCKKEVSVKGMAVHLKVCLSVPVTCPNQCGLEGISREELANHLPTCPMSGNACPFTEWGCEYAGGRQMLQKHIKDEPIRHLSYLCDGVIELKAMLAFMQLNTEKMIRTIGTLETKSSNLEKMYGAQLVWKIDNIQQRRNEAKSSARPTIFSPPFMSSRHGYKMCLSACLYGDGPSRGHYFAVYVTILRGEYDALLQWPFVHKVTVSLMDQGAVEKDRVNIDYVIRPTAGRENKAFLDRPVSERNASFGAQKMCLLETLNSYIIDDSIFLKCSVDTETMPIL
ncbi:trf-1 [Pristionchus pacificus]|nr:trf-1 [Pristionchus pacificus]|eukprot:PDM62966.1 trf-1 [Pristionchus pacificus]